MATTHPRSRPIYCSPPLGYAAQREDVEYCTHLLTRRLCASSRATASLIVAHARSSSAFRTPTCKSRANCVFVARCLLSTPVGRRSASPAARCMPSRSCWARSCCQLLHATCVAFSSLARLHLPLRLALVRQQLVDPHRVLRQLHQTARGMQWSTMQLTYAMARPRGATTQSTAGNAMHDAAMSTSNNRRVQHMACSTQRTTCNRQHAG